MDSISVINHNRIGWYTQMDEKEVKKTAEKENATEVTAKKVSSKINKNVIEKFFSFWLPAIVAVGTVVLGVIDRHIFYENFPQKLENIEATFFTKDAAGELEDNLNASMKSLINDLKEELKADIKDMRGELNTRIDDMEKELKDEIKTNRENIGTARYDLAKLEGKLSPIIVASTDYKGETPLIQADLEKSVNVSTSLFMNNPTVLKTQVIAKDSNGKEFTVEEMENTPMVFSYVEKNRIVMFLGQLNENDHWNGNCITNVYEDGSLIYIMDATYEDGIVTNYNQVLKGKNSSGTDSWYVANRTNQGEFNSGETWQFKYEDSIISLTESTDNLSSNSAITSEAFKYLLTAPREGYYNGNTTNGNYNDTTGQAYLVKFFDNGKVKTLYQGNFKDGVFEDDTGNAWDISKENDTPYMYYKGYYKDGDKINNEGSTFEHDLTLERIQEILGNKTYNVDLEWDYQIY